MPQPAFQNEGFCISILRQPVFVDDGDAVVPRSSVTIGVSGSKGLGQLSVAESERNRRGWSEEAGCSSPGAKTNKRNTLTALYLREFSAGVSYRE